MNIDDFIALVHSRHSVRHFKSDPISPELLDKVLEAGRWAMSGANAQPWEFVVVDDAIVKESLTESWVKARKETLVIEQARQAELRHPNFYNPAILPTFKDAPVFIVVLGDRRTYQATVLAAHYMLGEGGTDSTYLKNIGNATLMMHLAAAALRLGTQWVSISRICGESIKQILGIPAVLDVHTIVAVGYPASAPTPSQRRPLEQMVHHNHYEIDKYRTAEDIQLFLRELRQTTQGSYKHHDSKSI